MADRAVEKIRLGNNVENGHFAVAFRRVAEVGGNLQRSHHFWGNINTGFVCNRVRVPSFTIQQTPFLLSF